MSRQPGMGLDSHLTPAIFDQIQGESTDKEKTAGALSGVLYKDPFQCYLAPLTHALLNFRTFWRLRNRLYPFSIRVLVSYL